MYRRYFNPWHDMDQLKNEMNRLLSNHMPTHRTVSSYPAMNVWANEEEAVITTEIPGVSPENIDISVVGETLTLKGTHTPDEIPEEACCYRQERASGSFTRAIELPYNVDANKVEAVFSKGVLRIKLPRAEEDKPRKITVKAA
ncbi:MAG: Hsp20/alpha crystallin family protein [Chloroflexota bacterium]